MKQLLLVRHGATTATDRRAFGTDEPLTDLGRAQAAALATLLPVEATILCSPKLRCRQTASAAGLETTIEAGLIECCFGDWEGRTFAEIEAADRQLAHDWLADPAVAAPGGESLAGFAVRVGGWLERVAAILDDVVIAITHAGVIKAAVVHTLGAPLESFWRIEVDPLSITDFRVDAGRWSLHRLNRTTV